MRVQIYIFFLKQWEHQNQTYKYLIGLLEGMPKIFQKSATSVFLQSNKKRSGKEEEYDDEFLLVAG
jgi:hypothetical protein